MLSSKGGHPLLSLKLNVPFCTQVDAGVISRQLGHVMGKFNAQAKKQ